MKQFRTSCIWVTSEGKILLNKVTKVPDSFAIEHKGTQQKMGYQQIVYEVYPQRKALDMIRLNMQHGQHAYYDDDGNVYTSHLPKHQFETMVGKELKEVRAGHIYSDDTGVKIEIPKSRSY